MDEGGKPRIKNGNQSFEVLPEAVVSLFASSNPPDLFDRVQIRRIRWQRNNGNDLTDVCVFLLTLYQPLRLFVPGCIIHDQNDFLTMFKFDSSEKLPDTGDCGFVVEPRRLRNKKLSASVGDKTTVSNRLSAWIGLHLRTTAFGKPLPGNGCFYREMNLVLKDNSRFLLCEELLQFFLKVSRFGSSS